MLKNILQQTYPLAKHNVIIADGLFPKNKYLQDLILTSDTIICCDGAINKLIKHNIDPHYIIGDCDNLNPIIQSKFADKIIKITEQNNNDLTKAINFAKKLKLDNIIILGATGLREDHTVANIALLADYIKLIKSVAIISDKGIFTAHSKECQLNTIIGQQISLFSLNPNTLITCNDLKWKLDNYKFNSWNNGTLNQAISNLINIKATDTIIVYRAFEIKK